MRSCRAAPQYEVEQHYISRGYLLPSFHTAYWIGLSNPSKDGTTWIWLDNSLTAMNGTSGPSSSAGLLGYRHWGRLVEGSGSSQVSYMEPNNRAGGEFCAAASFAQAYGPPPSPVTAGWADLSCSEQLVAVCRTLPNTTFAYTSAATGVKYLLHTAPQRFAAAEQFCNDAGGHLVSYGSPGEQQEVEGHFAGAGGHSEP